MRALACIHPAQGGVALVVSAKGNTPRAYARGWKKLSPQGGSKHARLAARSGGRYRTGWQNIMRFIILGIGGYAADTLEAFQFLIRRLMAMVFALGGDIMRRELEIHWADGIIGIAALPVEFAIS